MSNAKRNTFALILFVLTITLHIFYSSRLNTLHFSENRLNKHLNAAIKADVKEDYVTAETHYKAALKEAEKESPNNEHIVLALGAVWHTYIFSKRYHDAETVVLREVAVAEKVYGPESQGMLRSLIHLTWVYSVQNKSKEANEALRRGLKIVENGVDEDHKDEAEIIKSRVESWSEETQSKPEQNKDK